MGIPKKTLGKDFNFFKKLDVTWTSFNETSDVTIPFPARVLTIHNEGSGSTNAIEYSFNGNTVHGDMIPGKSSATLSFEDRPFSGIWFRIKSGSSGTITIRIESWGTK